MTGKGGTITEQYVVADVVLEVKKGEVETCMGK
jgi:hypothetical protein